LFLEIPNMRDVPVSEKTDVKPPVVTENIPSHVGQISAVASAHAPFLYFQASPTYGCLNGIIQITLEASRLLIVDGLPVTDRVIIAHLRMSVPAANALKASIDGALGLLAQSQTRSPDPKRLS
jgi:hypothetical protein